MKEQSAFRPELQSILGSEALDFVVTANRSHSVKRSYLLIISGFLWVLFMAMFGVAMFLPILKGENVYFSNGQGPQVASLTHLTPIIIPAICVGLLFFIGIGIFCYGLVIYFQKGGMFIGTPTRLISFRNSKIGITMWENFSGDIEIEGDNQNGNLFLGMRSGLLLRARRGAESYVPNVVTMYAISGAFDVMDICDKRIKENKHSL
jgi:hypothetical protein